MLALAVAWQAYVQEAPHLYVTAAIALGLKGIVIPLALHRIVQQLGIHRQIETAVGIGTTMLAGVALVALAMVVMLRVTPEADPLAREDLAFALAVVLLGLLIMVTRRNAGRARSSASCRWRTGWCSPRPAPGACRWWSRSASPSRSSSPSSSSAISSSRIRERFDTVDLRALDRFRGERP